MRGEIMDEEFGALKEAVMQHYGIRAGQCRLLRRTARTIVFSVRTESGQYVLKSINCSRQRLQFILEAEQYLRERKIAIPAVIPARSGSGWMEWEGNAYVLQQKIDGKPYPPDNDEAMAIRASLLGSMHAASLGFVSTIGGDRPRMADWVEQNKRKMADMQSWKAFYAESRSEKKRVILRAFDTFQELAEQTHALLLQNDEYAACCNLPADRHFLSHGDFHSLNVLKEDGQLYIIDWEFVSHDYPSRDMNRLLNSVLNRRKGWKPQWMETILDHYLKQNRLKEEQVRLMVLDMAFPHMFERCLTRGWYRSMSVPQLEAFLEMEKAKLDTMIRLYRDI